jgi:ElaB/YqjD/DUF883 family membrane-anchored ribosome-binding protein
MTTLTSVSLEAGPVEADAAGVCHTKQAVAEIGSALKADAQEIRYLAEDYVIEHPLRVVGLAVGIGFLLGVIWSR